MDDEQQTEQAQPEEPLSRTIEVVSYDVVSSEVKSATEDVAEQVIDADSARFERQMGEIDARMQQVADEAAEKAARSVASSVAEGLDGVEPLAEVTATLTDEQWQWMQGALVASVSCSVVSVLVCALLVGVMLFGSFAGRWHT